MKSIYLDIMEKALSAYDEKTVDDYINSVKEQGLKEHGFPRLAANVGILLAKGHCPDMLPKFMDMMTLCCNEIPNKRGIANDFSVKEICFALIELEKSGLIENEKMSEWKEKIRSIDPWKTYDCIAEDKTKHYANWASYAAASEFVRMKYLGVDTSDFVEMELASQVISFNENGLYKDPNHPVLYDFVARLEMSVPLFFGYSGEYSALIDENLKRAGDISLKYQSVSGEMPFGGRSNSFLFNEAVIAAVYEFEANRYYAVGDFERAGEFKAAAGLAVKALLLNLGSFSGHIKNHYDPTERFGCEKYAYFLKYMISVASFAYNAYLYANDDILPTRCPAECGGYILRTDDDFHKIILNSGKYYLEFDTNADFHYDSNGLGRIHAVNVPSPLCLSVGFVISPKYKTELENKYNASICCYVEDGEGIFSGADKGAEYTLISEKISDTSMSIGLCCRLVNGETVNELYEITEGGVDITLSNANAGIMLPVFEFDGREYTETEIGDGYIFVKYKSHFCRYTFDGQLLATDDALCNRNGRYRIFKMRGQALHIELQ